MEEALDCILKAQEIDSTNDETWYQKYCILSSINPEEALDSLLVAISLNPENKMRVKEEKSFEVFKNNERFRKMIM